ncbi:hypothetical protein LSTR_LSTR006003 [Laodelphax striatellus]|uniref:IST1 homolog n=1 Tax=Laodelphax striatellus TaxID=195883 RepID=A0A482XQK4_LAOST|nr:hypothetical protein LSTR_LSTR006003 [Laodelphax striatellus]
MFQIDSNLSKLKTNLKLAMNRLKLLQKKKAELTQKSRKEIADSIAAGKYERAKIRVEYIIREDYMVEAYEIIEMFCDILLSRFGLIQQLKTLDPSIAEAVSSLLWVAPHLFADVSEMKVISDQLTVKYGKKYAEACRLAAVDTVSEKLKNKLSIHAPPKLLVERYLVEIANSYNIPYEPDPQIMREDDQTKGLDALLFDGVPNDLSEKMMPQPPGFVGYPQHPPLPPSDFQPFNYPSAPGATTKPPSSPPNLGGGGGGASQPNYPFNQGGGKGGGASQPSYPFNQGGGGTSQPNYFFIQGGGGGASQPNYPFNLGGGGGGGAHPNLPPEALIPPREFSYNIPPLNSFPSIDDNTAAVSKPSNIPPPYPGGETSTTNNLADNNKQSNVKPKPLPRSKLNPADTILPELPAVPSDEIIVDRSTSNNNLNQPPPDDNEIDFDDIARRFEELKRKK